jgi:hypothetical protein
MCLMIHFDMLHDAYLCMVHGLYDVLMRVLCCVVPLSIVSLVVVVIGIRLLLRVNDCIFFRVY